MRLDKILANNAVGSRTEVKKYIKAGRIRVNGQVVSDPSMHLDPQNGDRIQLDGQEISTQKYLYYLFHKPKGYITAMEDKRQDTIMDLLPSYFLDKSVAPVGRLDKDTTGFLLLTNDGDLHYRLLSPKYEVVRTYEVEVEVLDHPFNSEDIALAKEGIMLNEEKAKPADLLITSPTTCLLSLREGKYHEVKRMMHALGKEVVNLHRISYGSLDLGSLSLGEFRNLENEEIKALYQCTGLVYKN